MYDVLCHCQQTLPVLIFIVMLPKLSEGSRHGMSTPAELAKVVAPLVIVGIIFIVMLIMLAVFHYQKKGTLCSCLCCRQFCNKNHRRMRTTSGDTRCACIANSIAKPGTMCEACKKWKASSGGLLAPCDASSDGTTSPEVRICQCTVNNGCGSVMCKMNNACLPPLQLDGLQLNNEKTSSTKYLTTEEILQASPPDEECSCPCTWGIPLELPNDGSLNSAFDFKRPDCKQKLDKDSLNDTGSEVRIQNKGIVLPSCGEDCNCQCKNGGCSDSY